MGCGCDDNNACGTNYTSLPALSGCPDNAETFLVGNADGGSGTGKYGLRTWEDIKSCIGSASVPVWHKLVFKIGESGSPLSAGDTGLVITVDNPIEDSELVVLDNIPLTPEQDDRISYTAIYTTTTLTINFNQGVENGQLYYIKYQTT